jgi:hypothetical protein
MSKPDLEKVILIMRIIVLLATLIAIVSCTLFC